MTKILKSNVGTVGKTVLVVVLSVVTLALATPARAVIVNGSFEADPWPAGFAGSVDVSGVTGWFFTGTAGQAPHPEGRRNGFGAGPTPYGIQWVVLGGFGNGGVAINQVVGGLTPGAAYSVSFAISSEDEVAGANVTVSATGSPGSAYTAPASTGFQGWDIWGSYTYTFVASAASVTLSFLDTGSTIFNDIGLDNVSISPVPEPSTYAAGALLLLPLAFGAFRKLRKSQKAA
jgi:hypothetical protein